MIYIYYIYINHMCACVNILVRVYSFPFLSDLSNQTDAQFDSMTCSAGRLPGFPTSAPGSFSLPSHRCLIFCPRNRELGGKKMRNQACRV